MKIICLQGSTNRGKTSTLNSINEHLLVQKSIAVANIPDNYLIVNTNNAQIIINEIL